MHGYLLASFVSTSLATTVPIPQNSFHLSFSPDQPATHCLSAVCPGLLCLCPWFTANLLNSRQLFLTETSSCGLVKPRHYTSNSLPPPPPPPFLLPQPTRNTLFVCCLSGPFVPLSLVYSQSLQLTTTQPISLTHNNTANLLNPQQLFLTETSSYGLVNHLTTIQLLASSYTTTVKLVKFSALFYTLNWSRLKTQEPYDDI